MADKKEYVYAESVVDGLIVNIPVREINKDVRKARTGYSTGDIPPFNPATELLEEKSLPLLWKEQFEDNIGETDVDVEYCIRTDEDFLWIMQLMHEMPMSLDRLKERFGEYFVEEVYDHDRPLGTDDYAIFIEEDDMSKWIEVLTEMEYTKEERAEEEAYYSEDNLDDDDYDFEDEFEDLEDDDDYGIFTDDDEEDEDDDDTK